MNLQGKYRLLLKAAEVAASSKNALLRHHLEVSGSLFRMLVGNVLTRKRRKRKTFDKDNPLGNPFYKKNKWYRGPTPVSSKLMDQYEATHAGIPPDLP